MSRPDLATATRSAGGAVGPRLASANGEPPPGPVGAALTCRHDVITGPLPSCDLYASFILFALNFIL